MGGLTERIRAALAEADPMVVARRLRLQPVLGRTGNAKFRCPFHLDGKAEANLYRKTKGRRAGEAGFGCDACEAEVASGTRKGMPDLVNLAQHVLGCTAHEAVVWLESVNAGQEPAPVVKRPPAAPKVETWESPIKGTKLGLRVIFGEMGAFDEAQGVLHVALTAADWEFMLRYFGDYKGWDPDEVSLVSVDTPAGWIALRTPLPANIKGQIYYRSEPTKEHRAFVAHAESKGCAYKLVDLDRIEAKLAKDEGQDDEAEDDEECQDDEADDAADLPVEAHRESLAVKQRALQDEIGAALLIIDPPVKARTTPAAPSVQVPTTPIESSVQAPTTPEPPAQGVVTTPEPAPLAVSTARTTPQHEGRPVGPRLTARLDPTARRQEYAVDTAPIAEAFLRELLASAPVAAQEVVKLARDRGISRGQVRAARDVLKVVSLFPSACWCLPDRLPAR